MSFTRITSEDRTDLGVTGLPDTPDMTASDLQARFDSLANLALDRLNALMDALESESAASNIGTSDGSVQKQLGVIESIAKTNATNVSSVMSRIDDLETGYDTLYADVVTNTKSITALNTDMEDVQNGYSEHEENISTISALVGSKTDTVDDGKTSLWAYVNALNTICVSQENTTIDDIVHELSDIDELLGTSRTSTDDTTAWGKINSLATQIDNISVDGLLSNRIEVLNADSTTYYVKVAEIAYSKDDDDEFLCDFAVNFNHSTTNAYMILLNVYRFSAFERPHMSIMLDSQYYASSKAYLVNKVIDDDYGTYKCEVWLAPKYTTDVDISTVQIGSVGSNQTVVLPDGSSDTILTQSEFKTYYGQDNYDLYSVTQKANPVGNLTALKTSSQNNVVDAVNELYSSVESLSTDSDGTTYTADTIKDILTRLSALEGGTTS